MRCAKRTLFLLRFELARYLHFLFFHPQQSNAAASGNHRPREKIRSAGHSFNLDVVLLQPLQQLTLKNVGRRALSIQAHATQTLVTPPEVGTQNAGGYHIIFLDIGMTLYDSDFTGRRVARACGEKPTQPRRSGPK
ncbi:hypothetical protein DFH07DRAFT_847382 [Mycena maculata]|uniref:Secreted protein n=1 Tax=Mycena maculata TaxID=230809 RepID=A0AAD7HYY5_9AGAR|nr:hypothetical protein DFH07DRAFT_847382 [Mycena maculata]